MKDLTKSFEVDNGLIVGGTIIPESIVETTRSSKPTYSGDLLTSLEFYNSLTQIDANRIAKSDFTYTNDFITSQVNTYYESDGTTVLQTETMSYTYTNDNITDIEVT
jgi:hypothetical protein